MKYFRLIVYFFFLYQDNHIGVRTQFRPGILPAPYYHFQQRRADLLGHVITRDRTYSLFYRIVISVGGSSMLFENKEQFTIFPLKNEVIRNFFKKNKNTFAVRKHLIETQLFRGRYETQKLRQTHAITSVNGIKLYVDSIYDLQNKSLNAWVQCERLEIPPIITKNGVIYKTQAAFQKTDVKLIDFLRKSGSHQNMAKILENQKMYFRFLFGVTLLAPFDIAFSQLPENYKRDLFASDLKQREFIRNHILTKPMCRKRLFYHVGWTRVTNNLGRSLRMYQDSYNRRASYIEGAAVLTGNEVDEGWVYGITEAILPEITLNLLETLRERNCHQFLQHLISTGYMHRLESLLDQHTLFAPTDKAFENLSPEVKERLVNDRKFIKYVIEYHITSRRVLSETFSTLTRLNTFSRHLSEKQLDRIYVNRFQNLSTVENVLVESSNNLATNGIVHIISDVLIPPKQTIMDIIQTRKDFRLFKKLLLSCNTLFLEKLSNEEKYFTVIIPINSALKNFFQMKNKNIRVIKADDVQKTEQKYSTDDIMQTIIQRKRNNIASRHIFENIYLPINLFVKSEISLNMTVEKINGRKTHISIQSNALKMKRYPHVSYIDTITARNGIIVTVDRVISKRRRIKIPKDIDSKRKIKKT